VVGDSFTVGSGVDDDQNLTSQLGRRLGRRLYNAGGIEPDPDRILALARRLGMEEGLVIHEHHEDREPPVIPSPARRRYQRALGAIRPPLGRWRTPGGLIAVSPPDRGERPQAGQERILPNSYASAVVKASLANGDEMLFRPSAVSETRPEASRRYWTWMRRELRRGGLDLFVVLVPSKYTVYRPLLEGEGAPSGSGGRLDRLERALRGAGIPVLNLTNVLRGEAERALARGEYIYWRDDALEPARERDRRRRDRGPVATPAPAHRTQGGRPCHPPRRITVESSPARRIPFSTPSGTRSPRCPAAAFVPRSWTRTRICSTGATSTR
jgi:hypothetical protein